MTVINMLSLGNEGIAVADEQSSNELRKYNVTQKLHILNNSVVYGGSGPSNYIYEIFKAITGELIEISKHKNLLDLSDIANLCQDITIRHKKHVINQLLQLNVEFGLEDFLAGILSNGRKLNDEIMKKAYNITQQIDNEARLTLLLGGIQNECYDIYQIDSVSGTMNQSRPYASIGSGSDESEKVLSRYVASLSREKRSYIDKKEGLIKIIEATNASTNLNVGVGGAPSIVYMRNDGIIIRPTEKQSILSSELVEGLSYELLPKDFVYEGVSKLVFENYDFEEMEEQMKHKATVWKKLDRILRGYKE